MKPSRTAALIAAAALSLVLVACGGSGGGSSSSAPATTDSQTPATESSTTTSESPSTSSGGLTPPGTMLGLGEEATVAWVPSSEYGTPGGETGIKLKVAVEAIEKGTIDDFSEVELEPDELKSTPYYVKVRIESLEPSAAPSDEEPDLTFTAIDDRGQEQSSVTFIGEFSRCNDEPMPEGFSKGDSFESCLAYLMPGGGSIQSVQWNNGPAPKDEVTPYFEKPLVWEGS